MRLGFDIDGVLANFFGAFIKECGGDPENWKKWMEWPFASCPVDMPPEERLKVWERVQQDMDFWRNIEPAYGSSLSRVAQVSQKDECYFITYRPDSTFAVTAEWLHRQGIRPAGLLYVQDKRKACSGLKIDGYIDDYYKIAEEFEGYKTPVYLIDRPWNRHIEGYERVTSVGDFIDKLLKK